MSQAIDLLKRRQVGLDHSGVIKALDEFGIKPAVVAGTSVGSIIGAALSALNCPEESNVENAFREFRSYYVKQRYGCEQEESGEGQRC